MEPKGSELEGPLSLQNPPAWNLPDPSPTTEEKMPPLLAGALSLKVSASFLQQNDPDAAGGSSVSGFSAGLFQFYILFQASAYYMDSIHVSIPNVLEHEQPLEYSSIVKIQYVQN